MSAIIYKITSPNGSECYVGSTVKAYLSTRKADHHYHWKQAVAGKIKRRCRSYDLFERYGFEACLFSVIEQTTPEERLLRERHWIEAIGTLGQNRPVINEEEKKELKHQSYLRTKAERPEVLKERQKADYEKNKEKLKEKVTCECGGVYTGNHRLRHLASVKHKVWVGEIKIPVKEEKEPIPEEVETKKQKAREVAKRYAQNHPDRIKERSRKYAEEHKENKEAYNKAYYTTNKERRQAEYKEWYATVGKEVVECECGKPYTRANKSRHLKSPEHTKYLSSQ